MEPVTAFLLSLIRGYELDLTSQQYQRVLRWFMIISEYFKTEHLRVKGLLAVVFKDVENYPALQKLSLQNKFALLIGMKTLIQCFESVQH